MNAAKLAVAIAEAERFLERAKALPEAKPYDVGGRTFHHDNFPKQQGAIKRASMELTRALADLRRPA